MRKSFLQLIFSKEGVLDYLIVNCLQSGSFTRRGIGKGSGLLPFTQEVGFWKQLVAGDSSDYPRRAKG